MTAGDVSDAGWATFGKQLQVIRLLDHRVLVMHTSRI